MEKNKPKTDENRRVKNESNPKKESPEKKSKILPLAYREWIKYKCQT